MALQHPNESEAPYEKPLMNAIVSTPTRPVSMRGGKRRVQVRPCTAPGSIPGHVFPSTPEGDLAERVASGVRSRWFRPDNRTQDSRRSRDRRGLQVKSRLKRIADPGGRPTLRPFGILNTEVHQCSFCPGRKTNPS